MCAHMLLQFEATVCVLELYMLYRSNSVCVRAVHAVICCQVKAESSSWLYMFGPGSYDTASIVCHCRIV